MFFLPQGILQIMKKNFLICGLTGWCMEILFTSIGSLCKSDRKLIGKTSIWMFPIYGIYSAGIFTCEYVSGSLLKRHNLCPWDYSDSKANVDGLIRLDYAPFWMAAGLIFEKILDTTEKAA